MSGSFGGLSLVPPRPSRLRRDLRPLAGRQFLSAGRAAFQATEPAEQDRGGVLRFFGLLARLDRLNLASRFQHDLVGELIEVAWASV